MPRTMIRLGRWGRKHVVKKVDWANLDHGAVVIDRGAVVKEKEKKTKKNNNYSNTMETELSFYQSNDVFFGL